MEPILQEVVHAIVLMLRMLITGTSRGSISEITRGIIMAVIME